MRLKLVRLYNEIAGFVPVFVYSASKSSFAVIEITSPVVDMEIKENKEYHGYMVILYKNY